MPAKVIVQSGISAGTSHWIDRPVVRVGSDPQADICLPSADVPHHALTLEYRDGIFRVYNRCSRDVSLEGQLLSPGQGLQWLNAFTLQLNEIELVLHLDEDPTPQPVPAPSDPVCEPLDTNSHVAVTIDEPTESTVSTATPNKGSNSLLQLAVIGLCLLMCVGLLARKNLSTSDRPDPPRFATVVRRALEAPNASADLVQRLQYAESAAIRGNTKSARERFSKLRDDLMPQKDIFEADARTAEIAILEFVEYRLGQLE